MLRVRPSSSARVGPRSSKTRGSSPTIDRSDVWLRRGLIFRYMLAIVSHAREEVKLAAQRAMSDTGMVR